MKSGASIIQKIYSSSYIYLILMPHKQMPWSKSKLVAIEVA